MAIGAVTLYIVLNANISVKKKEIFVVLLSTRQAKYHLSMSRYRYDHLDRNVHVIFSGIMSAAQL